MIFGHGVCHINDGIIRDRIRKAGGNEKEQGNENEKTLFHGIILLFWIIPRKTTNYNESGKTDNIGLALFYIDFPKGGAEHGK